MLTVLDVIRKSADFLEGRGVPCPRLNAEHLVGHVLGLKRMQLYLQFERPLTESELAGIRPLVQRRGRREPLAYILGSVEFRDLDLKVDRRALIPRPETEELVELLVERLRPPPARVLDLGSGTGVVALALAKAWPEAKVISVDNDPAALSLAIENAGRVDLNGRVTWIESDWYASLPEGVVFDLIVSNPPYLDAGEVASAEPEVREWEPRMALESGDGGLAALREIVEGAAARLAPGGWLAVETGIHHHPAMRELATAAGMGKIESRNDLSGRPRFFLAICPGKK